MLTLVTLDDANGNPVVIHAETGKRALRSASGLVGIGSIREDVRDRPTAHGSINSSLWESGRLVVLDGEIMSQDGIEDCFSEFRSIAAPMLETLDVAPALLKWTEGESGLTLQRLVKLHGGVEPPITDTAAVLAYQAQFFAEDPRAYSQSLTTATGAALGLLGGGLTMPFTVPFTFTPSSGGEAACFNAGNRPTPPILRIYGETVNPQLLLVETGERIVLQGTVPSGNFHLEVDTQRRQVDLVSSDGTDRSSRNNFIQSATTSWFELPVGGSTVRLLSESFTASARCDAEYRHAYA